MKSITSLIGPVTRLLSEDSSTIDNATATFIQQTVVCVNRYPTGSSINHVGVSLDVADCYGCHLGDPSSLRLLLRCQKRNSRLCDRSLCGLHAFHHK